MARDTRRVYRMDLSEFHRYLNDKAQELAACQKQTEEVKERLDKIFARELEAWQEVFGYCYPRVAAQRAELPPRFAAHLDQVEAEEQERIRREIADLGKTVVEGRLQLDRLSAQGQAAVGALREANPAINAREESLKAQVVAYQNEYARAYDALDTLNDSPLAWLTHAGKIRRHKKAMREARRKQEATLKQLRGVRQEWLEQVERAGDTQAELREQWQKLSVQVSEAQGRREHLEAHFDALAEEAAIRRTLEELSEPYDVTGELGAKLEELVQRNQVRKSYEQGLAASAEALGLLKGIGQGLQRFGSSVGQVVREQRRYNLAKVDVLVPHSVAAINQTWREFDAKVQDDKAMAEQPLKFAALVSQYFTRRLTNESIQTFFEQMGEALNQATKKWG
jgi:chromosome segregation ATPase